MVSTHTGAATGIDRIVLPFLNATGRTTTESPRTITSFIPGYSGLSRFINSQSIVTLIDIEFVASRELAMPVRIRLLFQLSDERAQHFALLKGLFEFGTPTSVTLNFDKVARRFIVSISVNDAGQGAAYLSKVFSLFQSEVEFKHTLRTIRATEEQLKRKLDQLYRRLSRAAEKNEFDSSNIITP